jgi:hypothetical protein
MLPSVPTYRPKRIHFAPSAVHSTSASPTPPTLSVFHQPSSCSVELQQQQLQRSINDKSTSMLTYCNINGVLFAVSTAFFGVPLFTVLFPFLLVGIVLLIVGLFAVSIGGIAFVTLTPTLIFVLPLTIFFVFMIMLTATVLLFGIPIVALGAPGLLIWSPFVLFLFYMAHPHSVSIVLSIAVFSVLCVTFIGIFTAPFLCRTRANLRNRV